MSGKRLGIAEALREAIAEEMRRDERVFCIGEDIGIPGGWGGAFTVTLGLEKEFPDRMVNTPISEAGFTGVAVGAAMMGLRPIADMQHADFLFRAMDQMANHAAKMRYMSGGKISVPMVMRGPVGVTVRGAQHAQMMEPYFLPLPGVKIVAPSTAYDAKGLLKAAVRDDNPVLMFEHKLLYGSKGPRGGGKHPPRRGGRGDSRHPGRGDDRLPRGACEAAGTWIGPIRFSRQRGTPLWHRRCAEVARSRGKPYLLHSCGKLDEIIDDLIDDVGIEASAPSRTPRCRGRSSACTTEECSCPWSGKKS